MSCEQQVDVLFSEKRERNPYMNNQNAILHNLQTNTNSWNQNDLVASVENGKITSSIQNSSEFISQLEPGQTFTGEIVDLRNGSVTIAVGEQFVKAQFQQSINVCMGEVMTFVVRENQNQKITIAPLQQQINSEDIALYKALDAAQLPATDKNIDLISELLNHQMPVDKKSIQYLLAKSLQLPEASISDLVLLQKYKIPITKENIEQLQQYRENQSNLVKDLNHLAHSLPDTIKQVIDQKGLDSGIHLLQAVLQEENDTFSVLKQENHWSEDFKQVITEWTTKRELSDLSLQKQLTDLLDRTDTKEILSKHFIEKLAIEPEDFNQQTLQETYDKIGKHIELIKEALGTMPQPSLTQVQSNLEFIKNVNESLLYVPLPLKMEQEVSSGELYVYTNKKAKLSAKDGIRLVLHLKMEYLGDMNVTVNLADQNLNLDFSLEQQETLQLFQNHVDELTDILQKKGFSVQTRLQEEMKTESLNIVKDVMESEESKQRKKRLTFDMRA